MFRFKNNKNNMDSDWLDCATCQQYCSHLFTKLSMAHDNGTTVKPNSPTVTSSGNTDTRSQNVASVMSTTLGLDSNNINNITNNSDNDNENKNKNSSNNDDSKDNNNDKDDSIAIIYDDDTNLNDESMVEKSRKIIASATVGTKLDANIPVIDEASRNACVCTIGI